MEKSENKKNCWEVMKCGREPGGKNVKDLGACPATTEIRVSGVHGGHNAGRCCWAIVGTFCKDRTEGTFAQKFATCMSCDFYKMVTEDEDRYLTIAEIEKIIEGKCKP